MSPDQKVEDALKFLDEKGIRVAPVLDENGVLLGMFSTHELIKSLVPLHALDGSLPTLHFAHGAAPVIAKRMRKTFPDLVKDHYERSVVSVDTDVNTWECLRILTKYGSPLAVVEPKTNKLIGLITEQSAMETLIHYQDEEGDDED